MTVFKEGLRVCYCAHTLKSKVGATTVDKDKLYLYVVLIIIDVINLRTLLNEIEVLD